MLDVSDLMGKYRINITCMHKELLEQVKELRAKHFPNLFYHTDKKRFVIHGDIQIKNFASQSFALPFIYKSVACYISIIKANGKNSEEIACFIHGDDLNILKEFAILVDDDEDDKPPGLYS